MNSSGTGVIIVDRTDELARLDGLVAALADGCGGIGWLQGEPGIGKSVLVDEVCARAAQQGCAVRRGRGEELMKPFPLRPIADCLGISGRSPDPVSRRIAALLRGGPEPAGQADPVLAAGELMLELVDRHCAAGPVLLVAEDLHWADEPTLCLWYRLARHVDHLPLLVLGTASSLPWRPAVERLRGLAAESGTVVEVGPLPPDAAAELGGRVAGGVPGPRLRSVLAKAGGNPLYVRELAEALRRDGLLRQGSGIVELTGDADALPFPLLAAIGSRLSALSPSTRRLLQMAALLGNEFDPGELATVTGLPLPGLAEELTVAVHGGIVSDAGERLGFRHELIRQVLTMQMTPAIRWTLHGEIARKLARAGHGAHSVARHLAAVPGRLEEWAVSWLASLREADVYAMPQVSAELLQRAVVILEPDDARWAETAARLTELLAWLGWDARAVQTASLVIRHCADTAAPADRELLARARVQGMRAAGRLHEFGAALAMRYRAAEDDDLPPSSRARLIAWSAQALAQAGRLGQAEAMAADGVRQALACGDPLTIGCAHQVAAMLGGAHERLEHLRAATAALSPLRNEDPQVTELRIDVLSHFMLLSMHMGHREQTEGALALLLRLTADAPGLRAAGPLALAAAFCYRCGRWDEALSHLAGVADTAQDVWSLSARDGLTALIALRRGGPATGSGDGDLGLGGGAVRDPVPVSPLNSALALRAEAGGDLGEALRLMSAPQPAALPLRTSHHQEDLPYLMRLALQAGDAGAAAGALAAAHANAAADGAASHVMAAALCQALADDDVDVLLAIASAYANYGWLPQQAFALEEAAVRLAARARSCGRERDAARAKQSFADAIRVYEQLGAARDTRRADARLREHGIRRNPPGANRGRPAAGWASLTPAEERIAEMVAAGMSNPDIAAELFLSRRTVQTHVSRILAKLECRSRVDVVRAAAARTAGNMRHHVNVSPTDPAQG